MTLDTLPQNAILANGAERGCVVTMWPAGDFSHFGEVTFEGPVVSARHHMVITEDVWSPFKIPVRYGHSEGGAKKVARFSNNFVIWNSRIEKIVDLLPHKSRIESLAQDWLRDTQWDSSFHQIMGHPSFGKLLDFGDAALSYVMSKLRGGDLQAHWFLIAKRIAGVDPVPPQSRGRLAEMAQSWLDWYDHKVANGQ